MMTKKFRQLAALVLLSLLFSLLAAELVVRWLSVEDERGQLVVFERQLLNIGFSLVHVVEKVHACLLQQRRSIRSF